MARPRRGKNQGDDSQEEGAQEYIKVSDTTAGGSTAPEDNPNEDYVDKLGILSRLWLENVRSNQIDAYRELLEHLFALAQEIYPLLSEAEAEEVLGCIQDTSGQYLVGDKGFVLQVAKEDCVIQRKSWKRVRKATEKEDVKKALDEYYQEADELAKAQNTAIDVIEGLGKAIDDHDTIVNILKHIQNPCI